MSSKKGWRETFYNTLKLWDEDELDYYERLGLLAALRASISEQFRESKK